MSACVHALGQFGNGRLAQGAQGLAHLDCGNGDADDAVWHAPFVRLYAVQTSVFCESPVFRI